MQGNALFCPDCRRHYAGKRVVCPVDGTPLEQSPSAFPSHGTLVDERFIRLESIGSGGMSRVFRAFDLERREPVALKIIKPSLAVCARGTARFFDEVRAVRRVHHANIVNVVGFGHSPEGVLYLAMELLDGECLSSCIERQGTLPPRQAIDVALQVALALQSAHGAGVLHRDLKPENIRILSDGTVRLLDFGIASLLAANGATPTSGGETVTGTPEYMSPEQITGQPCDANSDFYGLGVLLHEMLTGKAPFIGEDALSIVQKHLHEKPPRLSLGWTNKRAPEALRNLAQALLSKTAKERPEGTDIVATLESLRDELPEPGVIRGADGNATPDRPTLQLVGDHSERLTMDEWKSPAAETSMWMRCRECAQPSNLGVRTCTHCQTPFSNDESYPVRLHPRHGHAAMTSDPCEKMVSLLHVELTPVADTREGWRDTLQAALAPWEDSLHSSCGVIAHNSETTLRAIFNLYRPGDAAHAAVEAALHLQALLLPVAHTEGFEFRIAIATGQVYFDDLAMASPDWGLQGSSVDIVVRLARMAPAQHLVTDATTRTDLSESLKSRRLGAIRARGSAGFQPVHTVLGLHHAA